MSILGIDIGSRCIKVVEAKGPHRTPVQAYRIDTPAGSVRDGEIRDVAAVAGAVKSLIDKQKIRARELHIAIKTPQLTSREFNLPVMKPEEVAPAVEFDLSQTFPGIQQTNTISYVQYSKPGEPLSGLAVFCPTRVLEGYTELAAQIGVPLFRIDAGFNAGARALYRYGPASDREGTVMLLDVGVESSQISILKNGRVVLSRYIASGAHSADMILSSRFGVTEDQASEIRTHERYSIYGIPDEDIPTVARLGFQAIVDQIKQTLDYYQYNQGKETPVSCLYVVGGGSIFSGLEPYLAEVFSLPVRRVETHIKGIESAGAVFFLAAAGVLAENPIAYADVNLMPDLRALTQEKSQRGKRAAAYRIAGGVLVLFVLGYAAIYYGDYYEVQRQQTLAGEMKVYSEVNVVKQDKLDVDNRIAGIDKVMEDSEKNALPNTKLINELSSLMPEGLFIRTYAAEGPNVITLSGVGKTRTDIVEFMNRVRTDEAFSSVSVQNVTARLRADGTPEDFGFTMTVNFVKQ